MNLGKIAYTNFVKNLENVEMPDWDNIDPKAQDAWKAAARGVIQHKKQVNIDHGIHHALMYDLHNHMSSSSYYEEIKPGLTYEEGKSILSSIYSNILSFNKEVGESYDKNTWTEAQILKFDEISGYLNNAEMKIRNFIKNDHKSKPKQLDNSILQENV